jgi:hypothetical protein
MRWILVAWITAFAGLAASAQGEIKVSVENSTVRVGEGFTIEVNASGAKLGELEFPRISGLELRPYKQAQSMSWDGSGNRVDKRTWLIVATPLREGDISISGVSISIGDKPVVADPVAIKVLASNAPRPQGENKQGPRTVSFDDTVVVESSVNKTVVYENEPVVLEWSLWQLRDYGVRIDAFRSAQVRLPTTEGFYATDPVQSQETREKNGLKYNCNVTTQVLYPTAQGDHTIGEFVWRGDVQATVSVRGIQIPEWRSIERSSAPIQIHVKPLPPAPPSFSGAVGKFEINGSMGVAQILQGVPALLTLVVEGTGNPDAVGKPVIPVVKNVYVGEPEVETKSKAIDTTQNKEKTSLGVVKTFKYSLTPTEAGDVTIPESEFTYFDPELETYVSKKAGPFALTVLPAVSNGARVVAGENSGQDATGGRATATSELRPTISAAEGLKPVGSRNLFAPIGFVTPPIAYAALAFYAVRKRRLATDIAYARSHFARSKRLRMLDAVHNANDPAAELYHAVVGYIGDKFNANDPGMTSADVLELCTRKGLPSDVIEGLLKILKACERVRYSGGRLNKTEIDALIQASALSFDKLDAAIEMGVSQ